MVRSGKTGRRGADSPEYKAYIQSARWKKFRQEIMEYRAYRCQDCLTLGSKYTLQVHHLHYENFGHEGPQDVLLLCFSCHEKADMERKRAVRLEIANRIWNARVDGFVEKVWGGWANAPDDAEERFERWLAGKNE